MAGPTNEGDQLPAAGDLLVGKYEVDRVLGVGGMGVVVAARHQALDTSVAIKLLSPKVAGDAVMQARFEREARAAAKIRSEHIARVMDVGSLDDGRPYMVMELLEGQDLKAILRDGPLPPEVAVDQLLQACEAVAEAHAAGIVHRDLKPGNIFVTHRSDGSSHVKVLDFGISKFLHHKADVELTRTAGIIGSPMYMSPEQMASARTVDERTDVWSLGVLLYQMVSGTTPFEGENITEVIVKVTSHPPTPLRDVAPELSPTLTTIVHQCLEKDREARVGSVLELATLLTPLGTEAAQGSLARIEGTFTRSGLPSSPRPVSSPTHDALAPTLGTEQSDPHAATLGGMGTGAPHTSDPTRRRGPVIAVGALALAAVTAIVLSGPLVPASPPSAARSSASEDVRGTLASAPLPRASGAAPTTPLADPSVAPSSSASPAGHAPHPAESAAAEPAPRAGPTSPRARTAPRTPTSPRAPTSPGAPVRRPAPAGPTVAPAPSVHPGYLLR